MTELGSLLDSAPTTHARVLGRAVEKGSHIASSRRLNVLFVTTKKLRPLGADTWVHAQILRHLDRSTHQLWAGCCPGGPQTPSPPYEAFSGIPDLTMIPVDFGTERSAAAASTCCEVLLDGGRALRSLLMLARVIRTQRIQVVHTTDRPRDSLACVLLAGLTRSKCVIHVHVGYGEWMSPVLRWSLKRADGLVAISQFVRRSLVEGGHDPERIRVVLNGVNPTEWHVGAGRDAIRHEFAVPDGAPLIVTVCRLFPEKGPELLIRSLLELRKRHSRVRLLIVGEEMVAGYRRHLESLAAELQLDDIVRFTGRREDIDRFMGAADIFAMPSFEEPFGLVFLEAMSMGLPVVALASGGASEVIVDGTTGLLSEPGDLDQLVANLHSLLSNEQRRQRMGEAGRRRVEEYFTASRMAADMGKVYEWVTRPPLRR